MIRFSKAVRKYLESRAEPEAAAAVQELPGAGAAPAWSHVLTVPARRESAHFLESVPAGGNDGRPLVIVVVNGPGGDARTRAANDALFREIAAAFRSHPAGGGAGGRGGRGGLFRGDRLDVWLVDRASPGREFPPRAGVGLARKIGADIALALGAAGHVASPWIHASDGDAVQPRDRFSSLPPSAEVVAWTFPFRHDPSGDARLDEAIALYDRSLRYYVAGLAWAGSPWAFPTIGSCITVRADAYAAVRGFPRREAGEDFYLLAKAAKIGRVETPAAGPVRIRGRTSDRVPFGTGAAAARISAERARGEPFRMYAPEGFVLLREWLRALEAPDPLAAVRIPAGASGAGMRAALEAVDAAGIATLPVERRRDRFDAFATLRFLHTVRDHGFPPVPAEDALREAAERGFPPGPPPALG